MNEQEYTKAFNYGYKFKEHNPVLFETISNGLVEDNDFRQGFRDGGKQYEIERTKQQIKNRMGNEQNRQKRNR